MIIIVAPYPNVSSVKDGFLARIAYIDEIFSDQEKVYLWLDSKLSTIKPKYASVAPGVMVAYANPFNPIHIIWILKLSRKAAFCYFHSVYKTIKLWYLLLTKKCIIDLHGLATEELIMMNKKLDALFLSITERYAISHAYKVIAVTQAMAKYIQSKYPKKHIDFIILPIFDNKKHAKTDKEVKKLYKKIRLPIIYSGTASVWQAIDRIEKLIKSTHSKYKYTILTPDEKIFKEKINLRDVNILGVPKEEVFNYYSKNIFGLVIRKKNIVNKVSCPTKLIEYMETSILPVVEYTDIGDFKQLGYKYILSKDLINGTLPPYDDILKMLRKNLQVINKLQNQTTKGISKLREAILSNE